MVKFVKIRGSESEERPKGEWMCCEEHAIPAVDSEGQKTYAYVPHFVVCLSKPEQYADYKAKRAAYKSQFRARNGAPDEDERREYPPRAPSRPRPEREAAPDPEFRDEDLPF